jgi:hypothetical protein
MMCNGDLNIKMEINIHMLINESYKQMCFFVHLKEGLSFKV